MAAFIELALGDDSAVISTAGAALLEYSVDDRPVVVPMSAFDGAVLAPWPNRIADGRYDFDGVSHQLPITEPARSTALHGLVAEVDWEILDRDDRAVTLRTDIAACDGYPFSLSLEVAYALCSPETLSSPEAPSSPRIGVPSSPKIGKNDGADADPAWSGTRISTSDGASRIRITARAQNRGQTPAPFGFGFHPWFHPGADRVDDAQLVIPARTWFEVDDRLIPTAIRPFDTGSAIPADHGSDEAACLLCKDFRSLRSVATIALDDAFGTPQRGADGWSRARLKGADDRTTVIDMDEHFRAWQVCTGDELSSGSQRRAIALEPMTCAPNAFAAGSDYDVIEPGGELTVEWSAALH